MQLLTKLFKGRSLRLAVAAATLGCGVTGCHAAIVTADGSKVGGDIENSDEHYIYLRERRSREVVAIRRDEIVKLRHPGKGVAIAGAATGGAGLLLGGGGLAMYLVTEDADNTNVRLIHFFGAATMVTGAALFVTGAALGINGLVMYNNSKDAAEPPSDVPAPSVAIAPAFGADGDGQSLLGATLSLHY